MNEPTVSSEKEPQGKHKLPSPTEDNAPKSTAVAGTAKPGGSSSGLLIGFVLLISLTALAIAAYSVFNIFQLQENKELANLVSKSQLVDQSLGQIDEKLNRFSTTVQSQLAEQQAVNDRFVQHLAQIDSSLGKIHSNQSATGRDWRLAEVEYLLRLANQRILVEQEVDGAVSLLQAADHILRDAEGITAHGVREAIARDLAKLGAVVKVDVDGVFLKIGAQISQVDQLQQKHLAFNQATANPITAADDLSGAQPTGWWDRVGIFARQVLEKLGQLVDYRRGNERIDPILPPDQEYYMRQNLTLKLEQTQIALLKGNQKAYQYGLEESANWIRRYFDNADVTTLSMLGALDELRSVEVSKHLPDISGSLLQARQLLTELPPAQSADHEATEPNK